MLLAVFHAQPALLAPIEIATTLGISPYGMTSRLDRLEKLGMVRRQPDAADRRLLRVEITSQGSDTARAIFQDAYELQVELLADFSDEERSSLRSLLGRLLRSVES